jgi:hypothetical protein
MTSLARTEPLYHRGRFFGDDWIFKTEVSRQSYLLIFFLSLHLHLLSSSSFRPVNLNKRGIVLRRPPNRDLRPFVTMSCFCRTAMKVLLFL